MSASAVLTLPETTCRRLTNIEHFAMPTRDIAPLERFVREIMGGVPYYYAGYDDVDRRMGRKPHIFMRVGDVLFQCTEEGGTLHPSKTDPAPSPHWAFAIGTGRLAEFARHLDTHAIPFAGPFAQSHYPVESLYFMTPEGHKIEVCEPTTDAIAPGKLESEIDWKRLACDWTSSKPLEEMRNISPLIGERESRTDNTFGLTGLHHFTLAVHDVSLIHSFFADLLDAEPWDHTARALRIGRTGFDCTREPNSPLLPRSDDDNISPHWSFGASVPALDHYMAKLNAAGVPVAGPYLHRGVDLVSIYFRSPEGHKFEIGTWDGYPEERARMMGAPGVGFIPWNDMVHDWRPRG